MNNRSSLPITTFLLYPLIIISYLHLFFFSHQISAATTDDDDNQYYQNCGNTFNCGSSITGIRYPFRGSNDPSYCGYPGLVLDCDDSSNSTTITIVDQKYVVLQISQSEQTMKIVREDVMKDICPSQLVNATLDFSLFEYTGNYINLTFLSGCPFPINLSGQILFSCVNIYAIYGSPLSFGICRTCVVYPVLQTSILTGGGSVNATVAGQVLKEGFKIRWKVDSSACIECISSKGRCGYDFGKSQTTCFCPDPTYLTTNGTCSLVDVGNGIGISPGSAPSGVNKLAPYVGASIGGGVITIIICIILLKKIIKKSKDIEGDFSDILLGSPRKYSYEELKAATENFRTKLGKGGFGSVYKGTLSNGFDIAVKCLDNVGKGQEDESFLAEVRSIGSVHHYNLVKLIGFCTDKSHRLLVYEFMINGSLDRWIYAKKKDLDNVISLQWQTRKKIIVDIAKGLAYLHEECSQKIIHLDIKPQNILLDKDFNAKVSDFGLAKLIEKDQSKTVTKMRGTPGYLAPEWLSSAITEKTDVYSFGVVTLEIICGRKNLDWSRTEEEKHLLSYYTEKAKEKDGLWELVDKTCEDIKNNRNEAEEMMKIAAWCLQIDFTKRPSMSLVVKVLEGLVPVETNLDLDLTNLSAFGTVARKYLEDDGSLTIVSPSLLSAPR